MPTRPLRLRRGAGATRLAAALSAGVAGAHALSPSLLALREGPAGTATVTWKTPVMRLPGTDVRPRLPPACRVTSAEEITQDSESITAHWTVDCGAAGLVGQAVGVDGLAAAKTDALLRLELADGRTIDTVLRAREPTLVVPTQEHRFAFMARYVRLGFEHILTGYDHLLFVFGLVLLAVGLRALVATITAFTLGHSVTLTLAVLDVAHVPVRPVDALIAFSIFVLAVELARPPGAAGAMGRRPWLMAFAFGLLHGLGFAGVLRAAGLATSAIPTALLCFNVGIELGQLAFVVGVVVLAALTRPLGGRLPRWAHAVPVYAMGSLAAFWMIERTLPLVR